MDLEWDDPATLDDYDEQAVDLTDIQEEGDPIDQADAWEVISSFFRAKGLVHQQIDSFNYFLTRIPALAKSLAEIIPRQDEQHEVGQEAQMQREQLRVCLTGVDIATPCHRNDRNETPLFPNECRLRDMTYCASSFTTVRIRTYPHGSDEFTNENSLRVPLGKIPIMLHSMRCNLHGKDEDELPRLNECPHDQGGYFVINGTEKVMICQERQAANHVYAFTRNKGIVCEIKSIVEGTMNKPRTIEVLLPYLKKGAGSGFDTIVCRVAQMDEYIPLFVLYRALGMVSDKEILQTIVPDLEDLPMLELLRASIELVATQGIFSQSDALYFIGKRLGHQNEREKVEEEAQMLLLKDCLPHMGVDPASARVKCFFLGYMVHKMLLVALGRREDTDRDFLGNKRMDVSGFLLAFQFNQFLVQIRREMMELLREWSMRKRTHFKGDELVNHRLVTNGLRTCLATGNFGSGGQGREGEDRSIADSQPPYVLIQPQQSSSNSQPY